MRDYDAFQAALDLDATYAASLARSLAMVLDEFYANLKAVGVSAVTGEGLDELFEVRGGAGGARHCGNLHAQPSKRTPLAPPLP